MYHLPTTSFFFLYSVCDFDKIDIAFQKYLLHIFFYSVINFWPKNWTLKEHKHHFENNAFLTMVKTHYIFDRCKVIFIQNQYNNKKTKSNTFSKLKSEYIKYAFLCYNWITKNHTIWSFGLLAQNTTVI